MKPKLAEHNDDPDVDPEEIADAVDETVPNQSESAILAPEEDEDTEEVSTWDEAPADRGTTAHKVHPEDETPPAESFIQDGLEAADRDQRIAAADPDFEP